MRSEANRTVQRKDQAELFGVTTRSSPVAIACDNQEGNMQLKKALIREYVIQLHKSEAGDGGYIKAIEAMEDMPLASVEQSDVEKVVQPFLYKWGRMGRVLGQKNYAGWQGKLAVVIRANCYTLGRFRMTDLEEIDLSESRVEIMKCYEEFKQIVRGVASAKVLHIICPSFFPLWDTGIAIGARQARPATAEGIPDYSPEDYFMFMEQIQTLVHENSDVISSLSDSFGRSKLKVVDECLWGATKWPLLLLL